MKKVLLIDRKSFLEWYFDYEMKKDFFNNHSVLQSLSEEGEFNITAKYLLDDCGYIPSWVVEESQRASVMTEENSHDVDVSYYDEIKFAQ